MREHIWKRALAAGQHIVATGETVRETARRFGVSKSTIHKDVAERLPRVSAALAEEVKSILLLNKAERHLRGGQATRRKYLAQEKPAP